MRLHPKFGIGIFTVATFASFAMWHLLKDDWWGGIAGNMAVGLVTILVIDLIVERAVASERKPAVEVSIEAARRIFGECQKMAFDLYGATVLSRNITKVQHQALAETKAVRGMAPYLAATPLRQEAFNEPKQPVIAYLFQDALTVQQLVNLALATHSQYLEPDIVAALYRIGQSQLITFTISAVSIGVVPENFDQSIFDEFFDRLDDLAKSVADTAPRLRGKLHAGDTYLLYGQPGMFAWEEII